MLECLVIGDSLAVGVGQARPACITLAQTGITSAAYLKTILPNVPRKASQIVISLGVNDDPTVPTMENLRELRRELHGLEVVWLLPGLKDAVRQAIGAVARENGDRLVDTQSQVGPDHLHPTGSGYRMIAGWTQDASGRPVSSSSGSRFANLDLPVTNRFPTAKIQPDMSGNLSRYREAPIVVYPNTYNGRVTYGFPGNTFAFVRTPMYQFGNSPPH